MSQELQLGKYEFFPYEEKIQRLLNEFLPSDEKSEKQEDYLEKLLELKKLARPRNIRRRKNR